MSLSTTCRTAALLGGLLFSTAALADNGSCNLTPAEINGTYGFAGVGVATQNTPFAPQGPIVQSGTVTHVVTGTRAMPGTVGNTFSGTWNVTLTQNDSSGIHSNVQFSGTFQVSGVTCQSDFYVTSPASLPTPAFHVVFVNGGTEVRTISTILNLYIEYAPAHKL